MYPFEEKHVSCFGKGYMLFLQWMRALNDINLDNISECVDIIINIIIFVANNQIEMKYSELERLVKKAGCYDTGRQQAGHPLCYSPKTGKMFQMSNHGSQEVASGTLKKIKQAAGI